VPLKLIPPRPGKTPNYAVRGTLHGIYVDRTAGTPNRKDAAKVLAKLKADIESGAYAPKGGKTFADAALSYIRGGGEKLYLKPIIEHFLETPLSVIDQAEIDEAAHVLYPDASAATRNRQVYTPISAILKHAKVDFTVYRPKGAAGEVKTDWLRQDQAFRLFTAAGAVDPEFKTFLMLLCYTGLRLSEALRLRVEHIQLSESFAFVPKTKNEEARAIHLPPVLVAELANHPRGMDRPGETVCRFRKNGHLYNMMKEAKTAAGLPAATFHTFRHTWATWMRRYGKLDTKGLVATGAWKDEKSAARYQHVVVTEESQRADMLPTPKAGKSVE
jgi:integrase